MAFILRSASRLLPPLAFLVLVLCAATIPFTNGWLYFSLVCYGLVSLGYAGIDYWNASDAGERTLAYVVGVLLVVTSILLELGCLGTRSDATPLVAGVIFYVGLGWLIDGMRRTGKLPRAGKWLLLASVALVVLTIGFWFYDAKHVWLLVVAAVGLLVLVPVALNLIAESALWNLARLNNWVIHVPSRELSKSTWWVTCVCIAVGLGLIIVPLVIVGICSHAWLATIVAATAVLLLVAATVSNTRLDLALIIAVAVYLAAAPPEVSAPLALTPGTGSTALVAMGDSYMSGEGARSFYTGTDEASGDQCRRAPTAYAVGAVTGPAARFNALTFLACSGARTFNVVPGTAPGARPQSGEPGTQLDQLQRIFAAHPVFAPKLVIVSIGGNDAGFSAVGETCLAPGNCDTQRHLFEDNLPTVRRALVETYTAIRAVVPASVPIAAVPYPQPIDTKRSCSGLPLSKSERDFVGAFVQELDATVHRAATVAGLYFVDTMVNALAKQDVQLCDPHPGIFPVNLESVRGLASQRFSPANWFHNSLHPTAEGHRAMLAALDLWLDQHSALPRLAMRTEDNTKVAINSTAPPCGFTDPNDSSCQAKATAWVRSRALELWPYLFAIVPMLLGMWVFSLGVLCLRRRALVRATPPPLTVPTWV